VELFVLSDGINSSRRFFLMTSKIQLSDSELLRLTLAGNEEALSILYYRRQHNIYQFALQMSGSPEISEDVTQEVFMVLIRHGATFDETRGSLNSFLLGIARNLVRRRISREQLYVSLDNETDDLTIPDEYHVSCNLIDELARDETVELVRKAVLSLPARYREVVVLCDLQEMSYLEAATVLNCAVGTVRSRLHRARTFLLEKLRPTCEGSMAEAALGSARCVA
jgi:RNA polymerase sigma-70 factor, ECF subfamily